MDKSKEKDEDEKGKQNFVFFSSKIIERPKIALWIFSATCLIRFFRFLVTLSEILSDSTAAEPLDPQSKTTAGPSSEKPGSEDSGMEKIRKYFSEKLKFYDSSDSPKSKETKEKKVLDSLDLDGIVEYIKNRGCRKIITMAGAGISTCKNNFNNSRCKKTFKLSKKSKIFHGFFAFFLQPLESPTFARRPVAFTTISANTICRIPKRSSKSTFSWKIQSLSSFWQKNCCPKASSPPPVITSFVSCGKKVYCSDTTLRTSILWKESPDFPGKSSSKLTARSTLDTVSNVDLPTLSNGWKVFSSRNAFPIVRSIIGEKKNLDSRFIYRKNQGQRGSQMRRMQGGNCQTRHRILRRNVTGPFPHARWSRFSSSWFVDHYGLEPRRSTFRFARR